MRTLRYTNGILTILAVLLSLNLWTAWNTTSGGDMLSVADTAHAQGIANAGAQRKQMIDQLKEVTNRLGELQSTLTNGSVRVRVDSIPEN